MSGAQITSADKHIKRDGMAEILVGVVLLGLALLLPGKLLRIPRLLLCYLAGIVLAIVCPFLGGPLLLLLIFCC
jgi:hypothetical protein